MRRRASRTGVIRKPRRNRHKTQHWVDRLVDVPCFLLGAGPSLSDMHVEMLRDYFTIGINRAYLALDPTILLWQDISFWKDEHIKIHNLQAIKVCRDIADPKQNYYNFYLKGNDYKFDRARTHILFGRGASGPLAAELAVGMGARPVICIGMDCKYAEDGRTNFYGDNTHHTSHTLKNCRKGLKAIAKLCPVQVINCSDCDILGPRRDLREVIDEVDPERYFARGRQAYVEQILRLHVAI